MKNDVIVIRFCSRYFAIGLAAVGGGALIGLTGGLAAPFVAGTISNCDILHTFCMAAHFV